MKQGHRIAHLSLWLILSPLVAVGFLVAILARVEPPIEPLGAPEILAPLERSN